MRKGALKKLAADPLAAARTAFRKLVVDRARYKRGADYEAEAYWRNRFERHGASLSGSGDESLGEEENRRIYEKEAGAFFRALDAEKVDLTAARVLDVGCGGGFLAGLLHARGVRDYLGVDITEVLFDSLRERWAGFAFEKADITASVPPGPFDVVFAIDVLQHVVNREKLDRAIANLAGCMADGALLLASPVEERTRRHLFYVRWWGRDVLVPLLEAEGVRPIDSAGAGPLLVAGKNPRR